jgi:putative methyltransferase (TIGR04325 family)
LLNINQFPDLSERVIVESDSPRRTWASRLKSHIAPALGSTPLRNALQFGANTAPGYRLLNRIAGANGIFQSFAEARRVASQLGVGGHEEPTQSQNYSPLFRQSDYPVVYWLSRLAPKRLFDFGGALGNLYYLYRDYLDDADAIDWIVYDLPEVIERGRERAARERISAVRFTSDLRSASGADVLLISGALHYWDLPLAALFAALGDRPRHLLINRSPITDRVEYMVIQRAPQAALPCVVRNRAGLIRGLENLGYTYVDQWVEPTRGLTLPLFPDYEVKEYSGFYFRLIDQPGSDKFDAGADADIGS